MSLKTTNEKLARLLGIADSDNQKLLESFNRRIIENHKESLERIKQRIARIFEKLGDEVRFVDMAKYNRMAQLRAKIIEELDSLGVKNLEIIEDAIKSVFSENYYKTAFGIEASTGLNFGFALLDTKVIDAILLNPLDEITWPERLKAHEDFYKKTIRQELAHGFKLGDGYGKIAKSITEKTEIQIKKVFRIVATEGHRAQSAARIAGFEDSEASAERLGVKTSRVWISTHDKRTRDSHKSMDGKEAEEKDDKLIWTFPSGVETEGPGLSGIAEEDIHCRCTTIMKILSLPSKNMPKNSYNNFDDWYVKRIKKAA